MHNGTWWSDLALYSFIIYLMEENYELKIKYDI